MIVGAAYSRAAGRTACEELLAKHPSVTAIVAGNDLVALGCYDALKARGLSCPKDISIVGHNDMPLVDLVAPPLTTVRIRHHEMGVEAARVILRRIREGQSTEMDVRLKPELVVRSSTALPRRGSHPESRRRSKAGAGAARAGRSPPSDR